jgi:hypothetical protein
MWPQLWLPAPMTRRILLKRALRETLRLLEQQFQTEQQ